MTQVKNGFANGKHATSPPNLSAPLLDYTTSLLLVFGGCCSNAWSLERILQHDPSVGSALTFLQLSFISLQSLPHFLVWRPPSASPKSTHWWHTLPIPTIKPPVVPLREWILQVGVFLIIALSNNWAAAYQISLPLQTVFRSGGLAISMLFGWLFSGKTYSWLQIVSVVLVSAGVIVATLSRPVSRYARTDGGSDLSTYLTGIGFMALSLALSGALGVLQERAYKQYRAHWSEAVFYTHTLSLPAFLFLIPDIKRGFAALSRDEALVATARSSVPFTKPSSITIPPIYYVIVANLITQLVCVSGVNRLTSSVSSVSTNLVLTARKASSLIFGVWWFQSGWNAGLLYGGLLVLSGSMMYSFAPTLPVPEKKDKRE